MALAIISILAMVGLPALQQFTIRMRMTSEANRFLTMLHFTRSEAIKRGSRVTMCKSGNGLSCAANGNWAQGWIIFVDNGTNVGTVDAGETILRVHEPLSGNSTLTGNSPVANYISYVPNGQSRTVDGAMQGGTLRLCSGIAATQGRDIVIVLRSGRAHVSNNYPDC